MSYRILKIIHGYPPLYNAGSEVYTQSICNELANQNEVFVFTREENFFSPDFEIKNFKKNNISFFYINMARAKDGFRHREVDKIFGKIVDQLKPDIAHIGHLNHLSTGIIDELYERNIPIIFTLHDFWLMCPRGQFLQVNFGNNNFHQLCDKQENKKCALNCYNRFFTGISSNYENDLKYWTSWIASRMDETKKIITKVDLFLAPSKYLMNRFINDFGIPKEKIVYLDYGFPTYLKPVRSQTEVFTFGYIGTHIPAKGVNLLIEAFSRIEQPAVLKIWGRPREYTTYLKQMAKNSRNPVYFMGEYQNEKIADEVFKQVDCIVVPSIWAENSPLVIHEAQACHIPVITADYGGMAEYVQHMVNGLLFKHRDINDLYEKMIFALNNREILKKLGQRGYLYSKDGNVPEIESHCKQLVKYYDLIIKQKQNELSFQNNSRHKS